MENIVGILFFSMMSVVGGILIFGTYRKWMWLVDPPTDSFCYSHALLKKMFGAKFLMFFNYIIGSIFIVLSVATVFRGLR